MEPVYVDPRTERKSDEGEPRSFSEVESYAGASVFAELFNTICDSGTDKTEDRNNINCADFNHSATHLLSIDCL